MDKRERYAHVLNTIRTVLGPGGYELSDIGKMATVVSILKSEFREWVFCGFYRLINQDTLEIGPYQGDILACGIITLDQGVCGKAARMKETVIVENVAEFPGYISCDDKTVSEIVVPVLKKGNLRAVLDIDSGQVANFNQDDKIYLEKIAELIYPQ